MTINRRGHSPRCVGLSLIGEGTDLRARSNWLHAVAVTLPIIGESSKIKFFKEYNVLSVLKTYCLVIVLCFFHLNSFSVVV